MATPLLYARDDGSWVRPTSITLGVSKAALVVAILQAIAAVVFAVFLGMEARHSSHGEELVLSLLLLQLPLLIAALILGVLGHRPIGGRRWAGPAMWIAGVTPGASSLLMLLVAFLIDAEPDRGLLWGVLIVAAVDAGIVLGLRNRILKDPGPLPVIPIEPSSTNEHISPVPFTPVDQAARKGPSVEA